MALLPFSGGVICHSTKALQVRLLGFIINYISAAKEFDKSDTLAHRLSRD